MIEEFQCFQCKELPSLSRTKFYRCLKQHLICNICQVSHLRNCGSLALSCSYCQHKHSVRIAHCDRRSAYYGSGCCSTVNQHHTKDYKECTMVKTILEQWKLLTCRFYKNGCREINFADKLRDHQDECDFRNILCPDIDCQKTIPFSSFIDHCHEYHNQPIEGFLKMEYGQKKKVVRPNPTVSATSPPSLICLNGLTFIEMLYNKDNTIYIWVYLLGDPHEADRFQYHVHLKKESGKETTFFGKVKSVNQSYSDLLEDENVCVTSTKMIRRYLNDQGQLEYTLKIRNLKEELKDDNCESGIDDSD